MPLLLKYLSVIAGVNLIVISYWYGDQQTHWSLGDAIIVVNCFIFGFALFAFGSKGIFDG